MLLLLCLKAKAKAVIQFDLLANCAVAAAVLAICLSVVIVTILWLVRFYFHRFQ